MKNSHAGRTTVWRRGALAIAMTVAAAASAGPAQAERITRTDGQALDAAIVAIDESRVVLTNAAVGAMALEDLWRIDRGSRSSAASGGVERVVLDRGEIPVRSLAVQDGACRFDWVGGSGIEMPRSSVRALILQAGAGAAAREAVERAMEKASAADQVVAVGAEGAPLTIEGDVKRIVGSNVVVRYQGEDRTLSRSKAFAIVFGRAETAAPSRELPPWKATVAGDGWVEGANVRMTGGVFRILIGAQTLSVPWQEVHRVEQIAGKVRFLSSMEPVRATCGTIVTLSLPWQRDRSAMNQPLRLRGDLRESGLGVHAPSELVFDVPEGMQRFMTVVSLDEEYGRGGDCVVVVKIDDREAFRRRVRGSDEPVPIDVRMDGGRQITLRVEAGENLDLGDHVNWYDARLLR